MLCAQKQFTASGKLSMTVSGKLSIIGTSYSLSLVPVASMYSMMKGPATYRFRFLATHQKISQRLSCNTKKTQNRGCQWVGKINMSINRGIYYLGYHASVCLTKLNLVFVF